MTPDITKYHIILVNSSAGKDSQAMLDYVVAICDSKGVPRQRIVVVHADLGEEEWPGTKELAAEQAAHYGLRFEVVTRIGRVKDNDQGTTYKRGEVYGGILDYAKRRGKWPSSTNRWCTSDFKRAPVRRLITQLEHEWRMGAIPTRGVTFRLLNCMGMRAQESSGRAKYLPFVRGAQAGAKDTKAACTGRREVDTWLPIHGWTVDEVWQRIRESGVRYHPAYDLGMSRLSCRFCIFAPKGMLIRSGHANPELLDKYVAVEKLTGHRFRMDTSLAEVKEAVERGEKGDVDGGDWNM